MYMFKYVHVRYAGCAIALMFENNRKKSIRKAEEEVVVHGGSSTNSRATTMKLAQWLPNDLS